MQNGVAAFFSETHGYMWESSGQKINFSTEAITAAPQAWGSGSQQKGLNSKNNMGYCGNEGSYNGGYQFRRWDLTTDTNLGNIAKPHTNTGEENFGLGQDHQYMIGSYDGTGQTNNSWRFSYVTETGTVNNSGMVPSWQAGMSSGHCGWLE